MVFSSTIFLFYFLPLFLLVYFFTPGRFKNYVLLFFSIIFYAWGGPLFIFVILATSTADFILVRQIEKSDSRKKKKFFLILSLCINLGLLFSFKYLNFFADNLNVLLAEFSLPLMHIDKITLPIGISFFTFESLTYVIDVYRGDGRSLKNYPNYLTYILMFPKLIAGPIVSYNMIGGQIESPRNENAAQLRISGMMRFIGGLAKKVLIANLLGKTVEQIYKLPPEQIDTALAWTASVGYTMQLYFDFSGYSDMAIGLGKMAGFVIPENFNFPYIAKSITEFWKRWHMSLGNWMRNYLYVPLGGNKKGFARTLLNLWIVFIFSGLWHGAGWNFILWGAIHGFFMMTERLFLGKILRGLPGMLYTFLIVNVAWIFFKNDSVPYAFSICKKMFVWEKLPNAFMPDKRFYVLLIIAFAISISGSVRSLYNAFQDDEKLFISSRLRTISSFSLYIVLFVLAASYLAGQDFNPFIYFRF